MSPVVCKPPRHPEDYEPSLAERQGRSTYAVGLLLCVLVSLAPLMLHAKMVRQSLLVASPAALISSVSEPAGKVAAGDMRPVKRWVDRRSRTQLVLICAIGATAGIYVVMRR